MANDIRARKLLEASKSGDLNLFEEIKKIKGSSKSASILPEEVAGVTGETAVVEEFRKVYQALYNSLDTSMAMTKLNLALESKFEPCSILEADLVTW